MITRLPAPSLLHVCSDTRREFKKFYKLLCFKSSRLTNVYFDFEVDTLLFGEEDQIACTRSSKSNGWSDLLCFTADAASGTLDKIRCLSMDTAVFWRYAVPSSLVRFTALQQFTVLNTEEKLKGNQDICYSGHKGETPQEREASDLKDYIKAVGTIETRLDECLGPLKDKNPEWPLVSWGAAKWDVRKDSLVLLRDQKELP